MARLFITDRGKPAHVLLYIEEYQRITGDHPKIADLLAMPGIEDVEFEIPQLRDLARHGSCRNTSESR